MAAFDRRDVRVGARRCRVQRARVLELFSPGPVRLFGASRDAQFVSVSFSTLIGRLARVLDVDLVFDGQRDTDRPRERARRPRRSSASRCFLMTLNSSVFVFDFDFVGFLGFVAAFDRRDVRVGPALREFM